MSKKTKIPAKTQAPGIEPKSMVPESLCGAGLTVAQRRELQDPGTGLDPVAPSASAGLMHLIEKATLSPDCDVAKLEKIFDMKERWEATEARRAFIVASSAFRAEAPRLMKNRRVEFQTSKGRTEYYHATLDSIAEALARVLSKVGLTYRWETQQVDGSIRVRCILTHVLGHSESVSLEAPPDQSGGKNSIQAVASTVSYLQRYTLLAITGLATSDQDDDGACEDFITEDEEAQLVELMEASGADKAKFLAYLKILTISQLPGGRFIEAKNLLETKRGTT